MRESLAKASEEMEGFPPLARREERKKKKNRRENKEFLALGNLRLEEYKHVTFFTPFPPSAPLTTVPAYKCRLI